MGLNVAALLWGFAEATFFFIVPDVLLSWVAVDKPRAALSACLWATLGALIGGTLMFAWGATALNRASAALDSVPAISQEMCDSVAEQIRTRGAAALFLGPLTGTPYKIYAVQAGGDQIGLLPFLLISVPARLGRFALITGVTVLICRAFPRMTLFIRRSIHAVVWTIFYTWYFGAI
jgi:membrane protein YqaA with SNARE-associated domain